MTIQALVKRGVYLAGHGPNRRRVAMISVRLTIICVTAFVALMMLYSPSFAEERRCNELRENGVCWERVNGSLRRVGDSWYNPDDSETLECTVENFSIPSLRGAALTRNADDLRPTKEPSILAALPQGYRISTVIRAPEGYSGLW